MGFEGQDAQEQFRAGKAYVSEHCEASLRLGSSSAEKAGVPDKPQELETPKGACLILRSDVLRGSDGNSSVAFVTG
jgi:hypothetical protein